MYPGVSVGTRKHEMPFLPAALSVTAKDDRHLGVLAGGDELLDAVEDEIVAVAVGAGGDRCRVGAGMRLGQAEATEHLATRQRLQPVLLLLVAAVLHRDAAGQRVLHADDRRRGAVTGSDLLEDEHQRHVVHAGAAPFLGDDHAERAEFAELAQRLGRKGVMAVPLGSEGRQPLLREVAQRVADHFLFLGQDHAVFSLLWAPVASCAPA
jgi:hypothetical protein